MNPMLLLVVVLAAVSLPVSLFFSRRSLLARIIASFLALAFAAFCLFGFLATFEPSGSPRWPWQVGYGILGVGSVLATVLLLKGRRRPRHSDRKLR